MKSTIRRSTYQAIYRLLDMVSPLPTDCGQLCGAACCTCGTEESPASGEEGLDLGIYLLPGEDKIFTNESRNEYTWTKEKAYDFEFPLSWTGSINFIKCKTPPLCKRELRPIQCRTFPLAPHIEKDGQLFLILFPGELPYSCPLIDENMKLQNDFIKATYTVWRRLIQDKLILDLVSLDSKNRRLDKLDLNYIYPSYLDGLK